MALDLEIAWNYVTKELCRGQAQSHDPDHMQLCLQVLREHHVISALPQWFFVSAQRHLCSEVAPAFWAHFQEPVAEDEVFDRLTEVFNELYRDLSSYWTCIECLRSIQSEEKGEDPGEKLRLLFHSLLFVVQDKPHFHEAIHSFYSRAFKAFHCSTKIHDADESEEEEEETTGGLICRGCERQQDECQCALVLRAFHAINKQLSDLGLLERVSGEAVTSLIHQRICLHVEHTCKGNFEARFITKLEQWLDHKVVKWLNELYGSGDHADAIRSQRGRLLHLMYTVFARIRIQQLFDIVIEFPDSEPALLDLKVCLEKVQLRQTLVQSLRHALQSRLLHPGVNTTDILSAYIAAIRALRVLDPTGVMLDLVCEPIKKYLRNRDDTVRSIVTSLTEDGSSELSDELIKGQPLVLDESYHSDEDNENWESWQPGPVDADCTHWRQRTSDIISMLVNIYGSKELFVNEYRTLLADRILTHFNFDTEKEIRHLELLKLRFGESQLNLCEVMLKDVADSKRINARISEEKAEAAAASAANTDAEEPLAVNAMVLSAQFWPAFREGKIQLPEQMQNSLDVFTRSFETLKGNRTLDWKAHLGLVQIELELKDSKTLQLNVSPVHAAIIWHFQTKAKWTVDELSAVTQMSAHALRRKIALWQSHGLLREESPDTFVLIEEHKGCTKDLASVVIEEEEVESAMASAQDQREEELQVIWSYVHGMLTNLESLPLERIHSMLKMFAMQGPGSECSADELKGFLDRKVKEQKLICSSGVYRLPKHVS